MRRYLYIIATAAIMMAGCSKDDTSLGLSTQVYDPNAVNFGELADDWGTKGSIYGSEYPVTEIEVCGYFTADKSWSDGGDVVRFMSNQLVSKDDSEVWSYSPLRYWPTTEGENETEGENNKISFVAFAPYGNITTSGDEGVHTYNYSMSVLAQENPDLLGGVSLDKTIDDGEVGFELQHLLTKITLQARLGYSGEGADVTYNPDGVAASASAEDNIYTLNGVSFININSGATLNIDTDGTMWWSVSDNEEDTSFEYVAAQGNTIKSVDDENAVLLLNTDIPTSTEYVDVMADNKAIFVLPQQLPEDAVMCARIRRTYRTVVTTTILDDNDEPQDVTTESWVSVVYQTDYVEIPTVSKTESDDSEWKMGESMKLSLTFDLAQLSEYSTPLTASSSVVDWYSTTVDADIHPNIYIYSSLTEISISYDEDENPYGEFQICTNYAYNLRVPHHRVELDGTITSSLGFLFCTDDFPDDSSNFESLTTYHFDTETINGVEYKYFVPTLMGKNNEKRYIYVTKSTLNEATTASVVVGSAAAQTYEITYGSNDFAYIYDQATGYQLLYYDSSNDDAITAFEYDEVSGEINLDNFADDEGTVNFKIVIGEIDGADYEFDFSVGKSTREEEGLYVSSAIGESDHYGVNKEGSDPVYTLKLSVDVNHLAKFEKFEDIIGVQMINNGGGMITQLFQVTLSE